MMPAYEYNFKVENRAEFIDVFQQIALALPQNFLLSFPNILLCGGYASGKSLALEVIAKTLDDDYNSENLASEPRGDRFYLESRPCEATIEPLRHHFNFASQPACLYFQSSIALWDGDLDRLSARIREKEKVAQGILLLSGFGTMHDARQRVKLYKNPPALILGLGPQLFHDDNMRELTLAVIDKGLRKNADFMKKMVQLQDKYRIYPQAGTEIRRNLHWLGKFSLKKA
jgi:hypothetical protein